MNTEKKLRNRTRYRLHTKIRKQGYTLVTKERTIYIPYTQEEFNKEVDRLTNEFSYSLQTEIV